MQLHTYVNYGGNCEQAFRYYEQHLGGRVASLVRHRDMPNPQIPPEWKDKVLHARIEIGSTIVMGADVPHAEPMRSAYLTVSADSDADAERLYDVLSEGGEIFMKMEQTPFDKAQFDSLLALAQKGVGELAALQRAALGL